MEQKTNPMRHLDKLGIPYEIHYYGDVALSGMEVAQSAGEDPRLKKAAASVGEKSLSMIKSKELLPLTGYVHGGCSPLCTKRPMRVTIDATAESLERIYFSAGKVGYQIEMAVADLPKAMEFQFADVRKPVGP